jgi:hypothetical protein
MKSDKVLSIRNKILIEGWRLGRSGLKLSEIISFTNELFNDEWQSEKAARIIKAILEVHSPRIADIALAMKGDVRANDKMIHRFLKDTDTKEALNRLYFEATPFVIGDPTEIERSQATKLPYVGWLKDGKTLGFQIFPLAFPYHGRAIPFDFITYSSKTIRNKTNNSRNWEHLRILRGMQKRLEDIPIVLDREFSYEGLLEAFILEEMKFVIRLNVANGVNFTDVDGDPISLTINTGETVICKKVKYRGKRLVNLIGHWKGGMAEPLWIITNLEKPEEALAIYQSRMKIEESFKDLKSLLHLDKIMNKSQEYLEKMIALVMLAYAIGLLIGEKIRAVAYKGKKGKSYSGFFIFIKHLRQVAKDLVYEAVATALASFKALVWGLVPFNV